MTATYVHQSVAAIASPIPAEWAVSRGRGLRFEALAGDRLYRWKRLVDVLLSSLLLLLLAPLMFAIAGLIKLDSQGTILVAQQRVGRHLRPFRMLKFRSMIAEAELRRAEVMHLNEVDGPLFKIKRDPRITRIGSFLRRSSLDELPQLINVLRGDMSLVGPRPPFPTEVAEDSYRQGQRLRCRPGMTGPWQVSGRSDLGYDAMLQLDLRYVRELSLAIDLAILLRTIPAVLSGKGAW